MTAPRPPRHPPTGDPYGADKSATRSQPAHYRRPSSARPASARPYRRPDSPDVLGVQAHLTDRDRAIIDWVDRHGVLTTTQLTAAWFTSPTTAAHRLARLRDLGLLDRFHRPVPGAWFSPWHWVIGPLGAQITAAAAGVSAPTPQTLRARHTALANSAKLPHLLGVNQFFIDLHVHTRHHPHTELVRWWSETQTAARFHGLIHPDGHALWRHHDTLVGVFLEHDTGSEPLHRVAGKIAAYQQLAASGGPRYPILFWLPNPTRETNLRHELTRHRHSREHPIATAVATPQPTTAPGPAGPVWALTDRPGRWALHQLPSHHGDRHSPYTPTDPGLDPSR